MKIDYNLIMTSIPFDHPHIDWDSADLYQEFSHFRNHIEFAFARPLSKQLEHQGQRSGPKSRGGQRLGVGMNGGGGVGVFDKEYPS